jgi:hypothetical protein
MIVYQIEAYAHIGGVLITGSKSLHSCILAKFWAKKCISIQMFHRHGL